MEGINANTAQVIFGFLTPEETIKLARTCKQFRNEAANNVCIVVEEGVSWGKAVHGMTWEKLNKTKGQGPGFTTHHASTKQKALCLVEELKKNTLTFGIKVGFARDFYTGERKTTIGCWNYDDGRTKNYRVNGKWFYKWQR